MRILILLAFSTLCFGQVELVNNTWPTDPQGKPFFPDASATYSARLTNIATGAPIPGIPYYYTIKQYAGQGFHTHESVHGTFISRPNPAFISGEAGYSDFQGYCTANIEFNGFSGWYTICTTVQGFTKCVNANTRYWTGSVGPPVYMERYSGGLPPYDQFSVNKPQGLHVDSRHEVPIPQGNPNPNSYSNVDGYTTRWVTHDTHLRLLNLSNSYKNLTEAQGVADLLDITRASLPDGGVYDNDVAGVAPGTGNVILDWDTRVFEEHQRGTEADIVVPSGSTRQNILFAAATTASCFLGKFQPTGQVIYTGTGLSEATQIENYWRTQGVLHVTCKPNQSLRGGYHPGQPAK